MQLSRHIFYTNASKKVLRVGSLKILLFSKFCVFMSVYLFTSSLPFTNN